MKYNKMEWNGMKSNTQMKEQRVVKKISTNAICYLIKFSDRSTKDDFIPSH